MTIHETAAKLAAVNATIAAGAMKSNADCIRMAARIQELEGALRRVIDAFRADSEMVPQLPMLISWETNSQAIDAARAILAKVN